MWHRYRKTLIPTQLIILVACALLFWQGRLPLLAVAAFFLMMQLGGIAGAWWGARLSRKLRDDSRRSPLGVRL